MGILDAPGANPRKVTPVLAGGVNDLQSTPSRNARVPVFTKPAGPLITGVPIGTAGAGALWPWLLKTDVLTVPLDKYYLYTSTDHDTGTGGIALWTAPTPLGPFTGQGIIYTDTTTGSQTETPSVLWDEVNQRVNLYYQQNAAGGNGTQSTLLATSANGRTGWTRQGIVLDVPNTTDTPGNGHTGYLHPFRMGRLWVGYHLRGGGDWAYWGLSFSDDGVTWRADPRPLSGMPDMAGANDQRIDRSGCSPFMWGGQLWLAAYTSGSTSGATSKVGKIVGAPLSPDGRRLLAKPVVLIDDTLAWETGDFRALSMYAEDSTLYCYYTNQNFVGVAYARMGA